MGSTPIGASNIHMMYNNNRLPPLITPNLLYNHDLLVYKKNATYIYYFPKTEITIVLRKDDKTKRDIHVVLIISEIDLQNYFRQYPDFKIIYPEKVLDET